MASDEQAQGPTGKRLDAAVALAGSMGAGVAGLHVGGNAGAIMAASGGQAVSLFFDALRTRRKERAEQVFEDTLTETGLSTDELLSRLLMDDAHGELASRVLLAAQDAGTEEQLRALSRTLASGAMAEEAEGIGVELLFARALADLDSCGRSRILAFRDRPHQSRMRHKGTLDRPSWRLPGATVAARSGGKALRPN
jgi:hypothetical protein